MGLSDKIFFTGPISDREIIRAWYTRADLFLFPSTFDSNGLVVREAAACFLASVLIAGSCAAEGVTDGHNAFLISENADSMADLLIKVADDRAFMKQVGEHAGNELYISWEDSVKAAMERYNVVLELQKIGAFDEKRTFSDNLLLTQGDLMYTVSKVGKALNQGRILAQYIIYNSKETVSASARNNSVKSKNVPAKRSKTVKKTSHVTNKKAGNTLIVTGSSMGTADAEKINRAIRNSKNIKL